MRFVVNSGILPLQMDPLSCHTAVPKLLKEAGINDVKIRTCYCCNKDKRVVFEVEATSKDFLANALQKIDFPVESIMETQKM